MYYVVNFPYYAVVEHVLPYVVVQLTKFVPYELKVGRQHVAVPTVSMHHKSRWKRRAAILLVHALCQCYGVM